MTLERPNALEAARREAGWTKTELSRRSGVSAQLIWMIETGRVTNPRIDTARALSEALGRPVEALFALDGSSGKGESSGATPPTTSSDDRPVASTPPDLTASDERVGNRGAK